MSNLSEFIGGGIKSVQTGTTGTTFSTTVTINAVDTAKSFVTINGTSANSSSSSASPYGRAILLNSTTVQIDELNAFSNANVNVYWSVVEYY
jgi:hypothetical protein